MLRSLLATNILLLFMLPCMAQDKQDVFENLQAQLKKSAPDTNRISILVRLGDAYVMKKGEDPVDLNNAISYADQAWKLSVALKEPRWEGKSLTVISNALREKKQLPESRNYINKAIETLKKCACNSDLGNAYIAMAMIIVPKTEEECRQKIDFYRQAENYFNLSGETTKEADVLQNIGELYSMEGDNIHAIAEYNKTVALYERIHYRQMQSIYDMIADTYLDMDDDARSLKYTFLAIKYGEETGDTTQQMSTIYNRAGVRQVYMRLYPDAQTCYYKGLAIAKKNLDTPSIKIIYINIVDVKTKMRHYDAALDILNELRVFYPSPLENPGIISSIVIAELGKKDYDKARPYVQQLIGIEKNIDELAMSRQIYILSAIIDYFIDTKQPGEAYHYINEDISLCKKYYSNVGKLSHAYYWLFKADSLSARYAAAITDYEIYSTLKDSTFNKDKSKQIERLRVEYETEKKESDIKMLTKQSQLDHAQLARVKLTRNIIIGSAGMLLLLLGISYYGYRSKQRSNHRLEAKQIEINEKNESLALLVKEKDWLVKEMHHRVKNNLQIVMDLLYTQSMYLNNVAAQTAIRESQDRMQAISLIHQKLYQSENDTIINMSSYIHELTAYLHNGTGAGRDIRFEKDIEPVELDIVQAIPIGLILNEAITNAIKYAFPENRTGVIFVSMKKTKTGKIVLRIDDNGIGLPADYNRDKIGSLGMSLIKGLVNQLGGIFTLENNDGLKIAIEFPDTKNTNVT